MSTPDYLIRKSKRACMLRISISLDSRVIVTIPYGISEERAAKFVLEKQKWIADKMEVMKKMSEKNAAIITPRGTKKELEQYKSAAYALVQERLAYFNQYYGYTWNMVSIKNTSSRWGSCSRKGNLNFNYKIVMLRPPLADYLVVHEMCHLKEFNHSQRFWKLVEKAIPDYVILRKELKGV